MGAIRLAVVGVAAATLVAAVPPRAANADGELELGGLRLVRLQADVEPGDNAGNGPDAIDLDPDDGGWDWTVGTATPEHSAAASPTNTLGITAMGALHAFSRGTPDPRYFRAALIAEERMDFLATDRSPDFAYRILLSKLAVDPSFAETARSIWITKMNSFGGAQAYGEAVRDSRESQGIGALYPWDLLWAVVSAGLLEKRFPGEGFRSDAIALCFVIYSDTQSVDPVFDLDDPSQDFHSLGLAGLVIAFRHARQFPDVRSEAYDKLLAAQNPDGGFNWSATYPDSDPQVTAYAVIAASALRSDPRSIPAAQVASNWLATLQTPLGGFENYPPTGDENTEVDSEIIIAFSRVPPASSFAGGGGHQWTKRPPAYARVLAD